MSRQDYCENENKKGRPRPQKKGGLLGKILCLFLGLILGVAATVGGVVGVGYWTVKKPMKEPVETLDKYIDIDLYELLFGSYDDNGEFVAGILNEQYADMSAIDAAKDIGDKFSDMKNATMADLIAVSPIMEEYVDTLIESTNDYAICLDKERVLATSFGNLWDYVLDTTKSASIGDLFSSFSDEPLNNTMLALAYGEKGVDYTFDENGEVVMLNGAKKTTINDLMSGDMMSIIGRLPLSDFIEVNTSDEIMMSIMFGPSSHYSVNGDEVTMNQVQYGYQTRLRTLGDYQFFNDKGEEIKYLSCNVSAKDSNVLILTLNENETQYLQFVDGDTVNVYRDEACSTALLYKKTLIQDLEEDSMSIISDLVLGDVLEIGPKSNKILRSLAYGLYGTDYVIENNKIVSINSPRTIGDLQSKSSDLINEIALSDVISNEDTSNNILMYMLYGKANVHYKLGSDGIEMLQRRIAVYYDDICNSTYFLNEYGETIYVMEGEVAPSTYTENGVTYKLVNSGLGTLTAVIERGSFDWIGEVGEEVPSSTPTISAQQYYLTDMADASVYYQQTTLGDLSSENGEETLIDKVTARLTIGDVLPDAYTNKILKHLVNTTIDGLSTRVSALTVGEVFAEDLSDNQMLTALKDYRLEEIPTAIYEINVGDMFSQEDLNNNPLLFALKEKGSTLDTIATDMYDIPIGDVLKANQKDTPLVQALIREGATLNDISTKVNELTLGDLFTPDEIASSTILTAFQTSTLNDLPKEMKEKTVGDIFGDKITSDNKLLNSDVIKNCTIEALPDTINSLTLGAVFGDELNDNTVLKHLSGTALNDIPNAVENLTIMDIFGKDTNNDGEKDTVVYTDENGVERTNKTLTSLGQYTIKQLPGKIDSLTLNEVLDIPSDNKLLMPLANTTLADLPSAAENLTLKDVFAEDIATHKLLKHLANEKLENIPNAVGNLTFGQVFFDDITKVPNKAEFLYDDAEGKYYVLVSVEDEEELQKIWIEVETDENGDYYTDIRGEKVYENDWIDDKGCEIHFTQAIESYVDDNGNPVNVGDYIDLLGNKIGFNGEEHMAAPTYVSGVWKYLLEDPVTNVIHGEYKVADDMTKLTDNMVENMHDARLYDLKHDGVLNLSEEMLNKELATSIKSISVNDYTSGITFSEGTKLGELTTEEILIYVDALLKVIDIVEQTP